MAPAPATTNTLAEQPERARRTGRPPAPRQGTAQEPREATAQEPRQPTERERRHTKRPTSAAALDRPTPAAESTDPARRAAYDVLRSVSDRHAYANLVLPGLLRERHIAGRDAALATELGYGTLRAAGTLDEILAGCSSRPIDQLDPAVLDLLRLGAYQLLRTRIPPHAAVSATVELARAAGFARATGFVNAVLRRVGERDWEQWANRVAGGSPTALLAARFAHPLWIVEAFAAALAPERVGELTAALAADDARPQTHLVARPGRISRAELLAEAGPDSSPGDLSPLAVRLGAGDPGGLPAVRDGRAGVQDEGSQLCALAAAAVPLVGRDERWLDLCAGPGGKAALLAALAAPRGAVLSANDLHQHRADLVRQATAFWDVDVTVGDATTLPRPAGGYDRILVDAPCTGLGALRRRPEARWRRLPSDVAPLADLQVRLVLAAARLARAGAVVAYVTCSPHPGETTEVLARALTRLRDAGTDADLVDARPYFPGVEDLGEGPAVQLWPHRQGTDAMFCAFLRIG